MSVQFGIWNFDGKPVSQEYLEKVKPILSVYAPEHGDSYSKENIIILYRPFHTTSESSRESQPYVTRSGFVITWDGRLDNRDKMIRDMSDLLTVRSTDAEIVGAAYDSWGIDCFTSLIGDWALSVWNPFDRTLILSKDFAGPRHLFYELTSAGIRWSTVLDPLVLAADHQLRLNDDWLVGYFSSVPDLRLTPYAGIVSVPSGHFVTIRKGMATTRKFWSFDPSKRTVYTTDAEYEEHFREVFSQAVKRRLRSSYPVLAELSGGMDSSSIVCMGDHLLAQGQAETPRLDTLSYYDDSEPNWNERPYFSKVEEARGRVGYHIDSSAYATFSGRMNADYFSALPGGDESALRCERERLNCITSQGNRVVLSGIGGDDCLGGVPTPTPELADLLVGGRWREFARRLKAWSLVKRRPWTRLLAETVSSFFPSRIRERFDTYKLVPWVDAAFVARHRAAFAARTLRLRIFDARPSFQANLRALDSLQKEIACAVPSFLGCYEKAYPYLDRDLLEFLYSVPREQIVRPGQRRSLMRRSLINLVPPDILNRKRKAFVVRGPMADVRNAWPWLQNLCKEMLAESIGCVHSGRVLDAFRRVMNDQEENLVMLVRLVKLELWLQELSDRNVIEDSKTTASARTSGIARNSANERTIVGEYGFVDSTQLRGKI